MIGENGLPFDGDEQPANEGEEPSGGDKQPSEGEKTPLGGGEESAGEDEQPAGGDERLNGTNEELPCTDAQPAEENEPLSGGDGQTFGLIGTQPAAEPLQEGDEAVQSVIAALETLSAACLLYTSRPVRVLQFGEGNFLRAFVDYMLDVANEKTDFNGSVVLVKPISFGSLEAFREQDCRYTCLLYTSRCV